MMYKNGSDLCGEIAAWKERALMRELNMLRKGRENATEENSKLVIINFIKKWKTKLIQILK